jgi:fructokinase
MVPQSQITITILLHPVTNYHLPISSLQSLVSSLQSPVSSLKSLVSSLQSLVTSFHSLVSTHHLNYHYPMPPELYAALEAGGTKFLCAVGTGPDDLRDQTRFPTTDPEETIAQVIAFFQPHLPELRALGIASFGPLDLDPASATYGRITDSTKPGWTNVDMFATLKDALGLPAALDTDVNGALFGEATWGAARGLQNAIYLTVGTGVGGGALVNGQLVHGLLHPEMGHVRLPHDKEVDPFPGVCPFHGDCLEGLASGPAIQARWGRPAEELSPDHPAWELEARYLGLACSNLAVLFSPQRIILGGGVMKKGGLIERVRAEFADSIGGYIRSPVVLERLDTFIVPPGLGDRSGLLGALALARDLAAR